MVVSVFFEMYTNFQSIIDRAFNYEEALVRQNLKQEDVDRLREKVQGSEYVPQFIVDKQVIMTL